MKLLAGPSLSPPFHVGNIDLNCRHLMNFGFGGPCVRLCRLADLRKALAAFAAVVAAIFVSSAIVFDRLRVIDDARNWRIHSTDVLETVAAALDAILDQETGVHGYLIGGDEKYLEPYHKGAEAFAATMRRLRNLSSDNPSQQRRLDDLDALANKWRSEIAEREIALMAKPETRQEALALETSGAGKVAMDLVRAKVEEIDRVERDLLAERDTRHAHAFATAYTVTILGGTGALLVAILMSVLLTRGITVPIARMTNAMTLLARGDTTVQVPAVGRKDEIGAMAAALQVFRDSIIERHRAQAELAHVNRVATMGQLTASIAHEVNQPIGAAVTNAEAALRWLRANPPIWTRSSRRLPVSSRTASGQAMSSAGSALLSGRHLSTRRGSISTRPSATSLP